MVSILSRHLAGLYYLCLCKCPEEEPEESTIPVTTDTYRKGREIRERKSRGLSNLNCLHFFPVAFMHFDVICIIKNKSKKNELTKPSKCLRVSNERISVINTSFGESVFVWVKWEVTSYFYTSAFTLGYLWWLWDIDPSVSDLFICTDIAWFFTGRTDTRLKVPLTKPSLLFPSFPLNQ